MYVAKKSLFDLIDNASEKTDQSVYLNEKQYIDEVISAVSELLNTRCIFPKSRQKTQLPLNYGLPYLYGMQEPDDLMHPEKQTEWAKTLVRTIRYFEPRLKRPRVNIRDMDIRRQKINIEVSAEIIIKHHPKRITFPIEVAKDLY